MCVRELDMQVGAYQAVPQVDSRIEEVHFIGRDCYFVEVFSSCSINFTRSRCYGAYQDSRTLLRQLLEKTTIERASSRSLPPENYTIDQLRPRLPTWSSSKRR